MGVFFTSLFRYPFKQKQDQGESCSQETFRKVSIHGALELVHEITQTYSSDWDFVRPICRVLSVGKSIGTRVKNHESAISGRNQHNLTFS